MIECEISTDSHHYETVRSIFDLMDFTLSKNIPGLLIFIDFQKAFDSLEWNFLLSCLRVLILVQILSDG